MESFVCWVVALGAEAKPLVAAMALKQSHSSGSPFPLYLSRDERTRLIVSGVGKTNAAAATATMAAAIPAEACSFWLNFGIAGSGSIEFGRTCLAAKVREESTGRSWYPGSLIASDGTIDRVEVLTVDRPTESYPSGKCLVEMESAGFYQTALRFSTVEFCQVLKVVSDNPEHPVSEIDKVLVGELCEAAFRGISPWLEELGSLLRTEVEIRRDPPELEDWVAHVRFTTTQRFQLRRLLQRWRALHPEAPLLRSAVLGDRTSGGEAIRAITEKLRLKSEDNHSSRNFRDLK